MRLKRLIIEGFGPFEHYELDLPADDNPCLLLTGRNNEGKSTIINAMKLLHNASKVARRGKASFRRPLLKQDVDGLQIGRLIHDYRGGEATVTGVFSNDSQLGVHLDEKSNSIYCSYSSTIPEDVSGIFGFIPPLGQLAEQEVLISSSHLKRSLDTTLAPRHLRNHLYSLLVEEESSLVRTIVNESWEGIELLDCQLYAEQNRLYCFYKENGITREVSWAGQGLQVWFQIVTHLVRLRSTSILVLDEPEIFLHPQKQNDLIRILREHYDRGIIMATHSVELMNSVDISHIIHVKKAQTKPKVKSTRDRHFLETVRSQVGSSFNLVASQFDDVDVLVFAEGRSDFDIVSRLAKACGVTRRAFVVPIQGFSEHKKSVWYKQAYEEFFGKRIQYSVLLDRDYYPQQYLDKVRSELAKHGIATVFTPGKEIENILLDEDLLFRLVPRGKATELTSFLEDLFKSEYDDCLGSFLTLHERFHPESRKDAKTVLKEYKPQFDSAWKERGRRLAVINGKTALAKIRRFYRDECGVALSTQFLINELTASRQRGSLERFVAEVYRVESKP